MKRLSLFLLLILGLTQCTDKRPSFEAPILKNIGNYKVKVTTNSEYAQLFFNQGIIMANGFNHAEAERSFRESIRQDSTFAMGYWGIAYVLGPNYNSGGENMGAIHDIRSAVKNAVRFGNNATPWEKAVINAIRIKFPADSLITNDEGYSDSMKDAYSEFPKDDFVATLYAESIMNLHAWDFYEKKGKAPRPWTPELLEVLEKAIAINPNNPLANHLYIHAIEAGPDVQKALMSAERLKTLVPSAGHLVHMPSHININTGDYREGSIANEQAVIADSIYIAECKSQGVYPQLYYPHNYHFLAATATFEGRGSKSIEAAYKTENILDKKYFHEAGYETVLHYTTIPMHVLVKFEQWEKILASPKPDEDLAYPNAIWHYARGMAYSNLDRPNDAKIELDALKKLSESEDVKRIIIWALNPAEQVCKIASNVLEAEILSNNGDFISAIPILKQAIELEDGMIYNEPPDWFFSVRHLLGDVLMNVNDYAGAELVYLEDLSYWPKNGFALKGLYESLKGQNKLEEAEDIKKQFDIAWKYADSELKYSRIDREKRKDLVLKIDENSPNTLVYLASSICLTK
ncbi:tetratricopeptide repeat protein [Aquiflexum sp.]|uniref:tetratricopeptide repeat protein n=1 Tax=Aquiflexum sp. TaxID=1872584 RepID=UPI003592F1ED